MNLTNKFIAGFTAMSVVALSILPVANLSANAATEENMLAYEFAFNEGLTTMSSYGAFNFDGTTTREAAARFLVKGAEALGADLSSDQVCDYSDLASADQSLVSFINDGCDMGIFKAQDMFNPKATFTRAQAELTIARIVYGMDEVNAYAQDNDLSEYAAARELLMADEIVQVEVPADSAVKRGHLALMIYRLADMDVVTPTDPTIPSTGVVNPNSNGNLNIQLSSDTPTGRQIPSVGNNIKVLTLDLSAGSDDVTINSLVISKYGFTNTASVKELYLRNNNDVIITNLRALNNDGTASLTIKGGLTIKKDSTERLHLFMNVNGV